MKNKKYGIVVSKHLRVEILRKIKCEDLYLVRYRDHNKKIITTFKCSDVREVRA